MGEIPSMYWMILIGAVAGFFCFVLYQMGMLIRDSRDIVKNTEETVKVLNGIVKDADEIVAELKGTVFEINRVVLVPVRKISSVFGVVSGLAEGMGSKKSS